MEQSFGLDDPVGKGPGRRGELGPPTQVPTPAREEGCVPVKDPPKVTDSTTHPQTFRRPRRTQECVRTVWPANTDVVVGGSSPRSKSSRCTGSGYSTFVPTSTLPSLRPGKGDWDVDSVRNELPETSSGRLVKPRVGRGDLVKLRPSRRRTIGGGEWVDVSRDVIYVLECRPTDRKTSSRFFDSVHP